MPTITLTVTEIRQLRHNTTTTLIRTVKPQPKDNGHGGLRWEPNVDGGINKMWHTTLAQINDTVGLDRCSPFAGLNQVLHVREYWLRAGAGYLYEADGHPGIRAWHKPEDMPDDAVRWWLRCDAVRMEHNGRFEWVGALTAFNKMD